MKIKLYAGILSLLLAGGVLDAAEENLLINPGFEGPLLHGGRPEGFSWSKSSSLENASGRNATKCARLTAVEAHKAFRASLTTVLRKIPAGTYRLNGYVRGESFSFAYVLISGKGWKSRLWKLQKSVFIPEKDAWRRFTLEIPIPEEREQLMLTIEFHFPKAGESVLLDDLSLIRTEKEALPAPEQKKRAPASEQKLIQNGSLVAHPAASVKVEWKRPVIAGREYWQMLDPALWRRTTLFQTEEFVREAGCQLYQTFITPDSRNYSNLRRIAIHEIEIFRGRENRNGAPKAEISILGENDSETLHVKHLNDGDFSNTFFHSANPIPKDRRYLPATVDISFRFPDTEPVSRIVISDVQDPTIDTLRILGGNGKTLGADITRNGTKIIASFPEPPVLRQITLRCTSRYLIHRMDLEQSPELAEELERKAFTIIPPYRGGTLVGKRERNIDTASYEAMFHRYGGNFLGFDVGEVDSNFFQFKNKATLRHIRDYSDLFSMRRPANRTEAEAMLSNLFALYREVCLDHFAPHSGALHTQQYFCEYGARVSNIQNSTEQAQFDHRLNTIFGRSAGRQYDVPWGTYLAYHAGRYIPGDNPGNSPYTGVCLGASPAYTLRYFLYCYYMGAAFQQYESQNGMMTRLENGTYALTDNGRAVKAMYEWTKKPQARRGDAYTPIVFLLDFHHGFLATHRRRGIFYMLPFEEGDYMTEHFFRAVTNGSGAPMDKPPYNANLANSAIGELCDTYFANPPSGVITPGELGKYSVAILAGNIRFSPELIRNLKQYVADGGTLLINAAHAEAFRNDPEFLGLETGNAWRSEDSMTCLEVTLRNAQPVMRMQNGCLILSRNRFGKGHVLFSTPRYMLDSSDPRRPLPALKQILETLADEVSPIHVEGDVLHLFNRMPDGTWKVVLINGKGVEKQPSASRDVIHPEYAAKVTLTVRNGENASVADVYASRPVERNGKRFSLTLPSGGVSVVDIRGIRFEEEKSFTGIGSTEYLRKHTFVRKTRKRQFTPDPDPVRIPLNQDRGILLEYTFGEESGEKVRDVSENHIDGRAVLVSRIPAGKGKAVLLSGEKGAYMEIPLSKRDFYPEGTFELWMRPERHPDNLRSIFCGSGDFYLEAMNHSWQIMTFASNYLQKADYGVKIEYGKWQHVVVTWKNFSVKLYVNGVELIPRDGRFNVLDYFFPSGKFYLGTHNYAPGFNSNARCAIAFFRILGREMPPEEVAHRNMFFQNGMQKHGTEKGE